MTLPKKWCTSGLILGWFELWFWDSSRENLLGDSLINLIMLSANPKSSSDSASIISISVSSFSLSNAFGSSVCASDVNNKILFSTVTVLFNLHSVRKGIKLSPSFK